jgi:trk system potassium uptake protein TrkA
MTQIAVIGMSSFGFYLARALSEKKSTVLAVDQDEVMIDKIKPFVTKAVIADATDIDVLKQLGLTNMDAVVISLGSKIDASILLAMHLKELGVKNIIAKANSEDHVKILELMNVNRVVFPEKDMGTRIAASLIGPNIADYVPLSSDISIVEMIPLKEMVGKTLIELDFRKRYRCQVLAIMQKGIEDTIFIPHAETTIKENHLLFIMGKDEDLAKLNK